ncbi:MAG: hypothetical protein JNG82_06205 [Opitutaceae bacterium]|nr:hypothetical protein [Opitutaceae bacterium]
MHLPRVIFLALLPALLTVPVGSLAASETSGGNKRLAVKGLSMDMPIEDAAKILRLALVGYEMPFPYGGAPTFTEPEANAGGFLVRIGHRKSDTAFPVFFAFAAISADNARRVTLIDLSPSVVDFLFAATEMGGEEFARNFLKAYKLGTFKPMDDSSGWYHVTADGTRVTITKEKHLRLQKVRSAAEQRSKFN